MARRLAIGSVQLSERAPRIVAAGGEAELDALAAADGADLVELRADLCEEPRPETLPALLARLRAGGRPVILTARAAAERGRPIDEARRRAPSGPLRLPELAALPRRPLPPRAHPRGGPRGPPGGGGAPPSAPPGAAPPAPLATPAPPAQLNRRGRPPAPALLHLRRPAQ